jgi:hypothetical protein
MKATSYKRIAAASAISGALGLAAIGFGAGAANADELDSIAPLVPGGLSDDWQAYLPLIDDVAEIGSIAGLGELGSIPVLGEIGNLVPAQDLLGLAGGF